MDQDNLGRRLLDSPVVGSAMRKACPKPPGQGEPFVTDAD